MVDSSRINVIFYLFRSRERDGGNESAQCQRPFPRREDVGFYSFTDMPEAITDPVRSTAPMKTVALAAALAVALWLSSAVLAAIFAPIVFERDISLLDSGFYEKNKTFRADPDDRKIPPQLPGPLDGWAGGEQKEIELPIDFDSPVRVTIYIMESHDSAPPALEIARGKATTRKTVPKGGGRIAGLWADEGTRSCLVATLPASEGADDRRLVIRSVQGSWAAIERVVVRPKVGSLSITALLAALALGFFFFKEVARHPWAGSVVRKARAGVDNVGALLFPAFATPGRAAVAVFIVMSIGAWFVRGSLVPYSADGPEKHYMLGGDEPEYMLAAHSLAFDGDLNLYNNVKSGVGKTLFNMPDYPPAFHGSLKNFQRFAPRMKDVDPEEWKEKQLLIHRPGLSALISPAAFFPEKMRWWSYFIVSVAWAALLAVGVWALLADGMKPWPVLAIALAMGLSPPSIFYTSQASPDSVFPLMAMAAALLLRRPTPARVVAASALLAALPWFSDRAIPSAFILGLAALALAPRWHWKTVSLVILGFSAVALMRYYYVRFGVPWPVYHSPRSPISLSTAHLGLLSALLGMDRGILFQAPVFALAIPAFWSWLREGKGKTVGAALGISILLTLALISAAYPDNTGGVGPAGRFNMALLWLSFPALAAWMETGPRPRALWIMGMFLAAGLAQTIFLIGEPGKWFVTHHPMFTFRWMGDLADLFPQTPGAAIGSNATMAAWGLFFAVCAVVCMSFGALGQQKRIS